jgi:hypothetical protein
MFIAGSTPSDTKVTVARYAGSQWHLSWLPMVSPRA